MATYVITEACIGVKDATCVDVCPAACIHTTPDAPQYYIDPEICIACEQCFFVCPVDAIFLDADVPPHLQQYLQINADFFTANKQQATAITPQQAQTVLDGVQRYAASAGFTVAAAVVDGAGAPVLTNALPGAGEELTTLALNKAYTAANLQVATHQLGRGAQTPATAAPEGFDQARMAAQPGGYPITEGVLVIGAVGVAGSPTPQQDLQCCQAGLAALHGAGH